jgi:hypothetical protein
MGCVHGHEALMENDQAKFDAAKFSWIGSMNQDITFCGLWHRPGIAGSFADMFHVETIFGSRGQASQLSASPNSEKPAWCQGQGYYGVCWHSGSQPRDAARRG